MKRRDFAKRTAIGMISASVLSGFDPKGQLPNLPGAGLIVPLGMDAHAISLMRWNAQQLIEYAIDLKMDSILFNALSYFDTLEEDYLKGLHHRLESNNMSFHFGIGSLSVNSPSFVQRFGTPKELILAGLRVAKIFNTTSVNCKIGSIADRYTDGGIVARMEELIYELRSMRAQIQDAGVKFAVENHAGDMRSEEVLSIVKTVGTDVCGVMLDPGNSVWAMENPMRQIDKLGNHVLCTSVRDYKIWESENGATFQWTALGEGTMDFQHYTKRMSELCPGVPLHIETVSNRQNEIPFFQEDFWKGYPNLKAADLRDFYKMIRTGRPIEILSPPKGVDAQTFGQELQKKELKKSTNYLREHCEFIKS